MDKVFDKYITTGQIFIEDLPLILSTYAEKIMHTSPNDEDINNAIQLVQTGILPINPLAVRDLFIILGFQWEEIYDKNHRLISRIKL